MNIGKYKVLKTLQVDQDIVYVVAYQDNEGKLFIIHSQSDIEGYNRGTHMSVFECLIFGGINKYGGRFSFYNYDFYDLHSIQLELSKGRIEYYGFTNNSVGNKNGYCKY